MSELIIVRHGEAFCNVRGIVGGVMGCTGLTDRGRRQAWLLGLRLADELGSDDEGPRIFTSPRKRAMETASVVARHLSQSVEVLNGLRDPDYGDDADGRSWAKLVAKLRIHPDLRPDVPLVKGGEAWASYVPRVGQAISSLLAAHPNNRILIVGHGETVRAVHHYFSGQPVDVPAPFKLAVNNASITSWRLIPDVSPPRWELLRHNDWHHTAVPRSRIIG